MVAAIAQSTKPWWQPSTFNWFDLAVVALLAFGFWRGRRRGMTKEFLPFLQWMTILLGAGLGHTYLADWLIQQGFIRKCFGNSYRERTAGLISAYLIIAMVVYIVFVVLRRKFGPKLEGSTFFGTNEYYWGIPAGLLRYASMILVVLALLNAPFYTTADIEAAKAYNNRWYGGGLKDYNGDFFPSVDEVQTSVFRGSFLGPLIKDNLTVLLINSLSPAKNHAKNPGNHHT
jgi:uncharacterized membrane protein required for colicin V production